MDEDQVSHHEDEEEVDPENKNPPEKQKPGKSEDDTNEAQSLKSQDSTGNETENVPDLNASRFRPHRDDDYSTAEVEEVEILPIPKLTAQSKASASAYSKLESDPATYTDLHQSSSRKLDEEDFDEDPENVESPSKSNSRRNHKSEKHKGCKRFWKYVYNKDNDTYCNRTVANWCSVCSYYALVMLGFFGLFMIYILSFIWRDTENADPAFLKVNVMPDPNPALALVPLDNNSDMIIWYKNVSSENIRKPDDYVRDIDHFLEDHELMCSQSKLLKKICHFNLEEFGPCAKRNYGYDMNKPCIFLKLNNLVTWLPTAYQHDQTFGGEVPNKLANHIRKEAPRRCVYVNCRGISIYDQEHLGEITYYPEQAFHEKYFPASRETKTNPLIAMKLNHVHAGYALQIQCTLLAANIKDRANSNIKLTIYLH